MDGSKVVETTDVNDKEVDKSGSIKDVGGDVVVAGAKVGGFSTLFSSLPSLSM